MILYTYRSLTEQEVEQQSVRFVSRDREEGSYTWYALSKEEKDSFGKPRMIAQGSCPEEDLPEHLVKKCNEGIEHLELLDYPYFEWSW